MDRAENSSRRITLEDVPIIKGMLLRGDRQHDIASWFGVNGGRIAEISKGKKFLDVRPKTTKLPPPGPYLSGQASDQLIREFRLLRMRLEAAQVQPNLPTKVASLLENSLSQIDRILTAYE